MCFKNFSSILCLELLYNIYILRNVVDKFCEANFIRSIFRLGVFVFISLFIFSFSASVAEAATITWTGTTSGSWSVGSNWSGGVAPVTGDDLVFPSGASNLSNTNDLTENTIINSVTFTGSGYTLSGNRIILGPGLAGITDSASSGGNEIALDIRLDATRDIFVTNTAESLTISGRISGVGGLNKEGTGTLILSGGNTFGGILRINIGVVNARHSTALGTIAAGTEVVGAAALELQGNISISYEALALRGYGVSGGGALRNISGTNTFGGLITLSSVGGTEIASDSGSLTITGGTTGNVPLVFDGAGDMVFSTAPIAGSGAITKNGAGTVTYNFPNTNTGLLTINAGTILYGVDNAILSSAITVTGGTLDIATFSDIVGAVTLGTLDLASGTITGSTGMLSGTSYTVYQGTISAIISGNAATLAKSTTGTVVLTRANRYTGATTVTAGVLEIQDSLSLGYIDGITTVSAGATLQINGSGLSIPEYITFSGTGHLYSGGIFNKTGNNTLTGLLTLGAAAMIKSDASTTLTIDTKGISATTLGLTIAGDGNTTFTSTAPIYGTSATLAKYDGGTLTLQAFNNFTGATNLAGGSVVLIGNGSIPMSTAMTISAGATLTLDNTGSSSVVDRLANSLALTMNGGNFNFIGSSSAAMDETAGVLTSGVATQSGNNVITITPGSGGSTTMQFASLTRTAGSSLLFRGTSFGTTPGAGVSTLLFTTAPTLTGGAGLQNTPTISIIAGAIGDDSLSGAGTDMVTYGRGNSNGLRLLNGAGFSGEYASNFATSNANVKLTASTQALTSSINSLILTSSAAITDAGTSQTITLATGNILNTVSGANIAGANTTIAAGAVELQVFAPSNIDISSLITTTGGFTKSGAGTLTFSTAKTYTGLTSVNGGTLLYGISNAISSGNVTVNGGTLDIATFTDTVGAVILQNGTITGSTGVLTGTSYNFREGTVSAIIAGAVTVTRIATNTAPHSIVTLNRDNTYTGTTTITTGILKLGATGGGTNTPLGTTAGGTLIASGGALDLNGFTLGTAEAITSLAGTGFGSSGSSNMGAIMNSSASPATYSGALTLTATARINADAGALTISGNASGNFALTFGGFSDITYSGVRSGTSTIVKVGINTLTLSNGNSSYSGVTTISEGTVKVGAVSVGGTNSPLGTTAGGTTIALGSRLDLNGVNLGIAEPITSLNGVGYGLGDFASGAIMNSSGSAVTFTGLITLGSASTIIANSGDISLTAAGTISGSGFGLTIGGSGVGSLSSVIGTVAGTVTKIGNGTWTLSGQSTYTGATNINLGTLKIGANGGATNTPLGTNGSGTIVNTGATLNFNSFTIPTTEALTINGFGVNDSGALIGSNGTFGGTIALGTESNITNPSGTMTITGAVSGAFLLHVEGSGNITTSTAFPTAGTSITKHGSGTFTLTGTNLYTGATRVEGGTFAYAAATTLAATPLTVLGGTFNNGANADTIGTVTLIGGTITNSVALTGTAYTLESGTISGILAGAIAVVKNTNNTVTLTGVNTISSTTTINAGTLTLSGNGSATSTTITVNLGGTFTLDNSTTAVASRIGDAVVVTMNGGNFNFIGNAAGASSETIGQLAFAAGHNIVTVTPGAGGSTTLTVASNPGFNRTAGATVLFRGTSLGSAAASNVSTIVFTTTPTLTGAGGASGSATVSIIKGAYGDNSLSGTGSDMVTYQGGTGLRLLNGAGFSNEYTGDFQTANANVKLTANRTAVATNTNSLILNGFGVTNPGGAITIPMASASLAGNILIDSATDIAGANTTLGITTNELPILATADSTISATIGTAAAGSVTLSGSGNVTLTAANPYTSTTFINGATLTAGAANAISSGGVTMRGGVYNLNGNSDTIGALTLTAGSVATGAGTLTLGGDVTSIANGNYASTISGNLGLGANRVFNVGDGLMDNDLVVSAVVSGAFTVTKSTGAGVMIFSGDNTYTGLTTVSAGTLRLGSTGGGTNTPLGTTGAGTTITGASSALDLNGYTLGTTEALTLSGALATGALQNNSSAAVTYSGLITLGAASTIISNYGDINISNGGAITGNTFALTIGGAGNGTLDRNLNTTTGTLTKNGLGLWTIGSATNEVSTFTGLTTISAGTLRLGSDGSGSNTPLGTVAGGVTVTSGAVFDLNGFTLTTAEPIGSLNGTGLASIGALINNSASGVSFTGAITMGAASRIANYGAGLLTLTGNIAGNFALTAVAVGGITQSSGSIWSGSGTLVKEGSGTLILTGQNTMTGAMTVSTGKLQLGASGGATNTPLGTNAGGVVVSNGAALDLSTFSLGGASTYETLNLSGSGIGNGGALISSAAGNNNFGAMTVAANTIVTNSGSGTMTFGGTITAANGINLWIGGTGPTTIAGAYGATATSATITKADAGTLRINAVSITTGLVRVNGGTLQYGIADALATPAVTVAGGTWDLNGFSEGGTTLIGAVTLIDGSIVNTGGAATITSSATYTVEKGTISAVLAGAAIAMNKNTGGTVTLSAANTFAGLTSVNAGTLAWGINNALSSGNLTITGGKADLGTSTDTVGTVTLTSGEIAGSSGVLTGTTYALASGTVSGILGGSIGVSKTTAGTVTMSGANTYTGTTTITAGTIRATSSAGLGDGSGTNTLIFAGGTLKAGGNISSPSGRAVTLTTTPVIDTNGYTVTLAGTVGSAAGLTKNGTGTLSISGAATLGGALAVNNGTFDQASSLNMTSGAVTVASSGVWSNVGTGAVTLSGNVTNSGTIILNSSNRAQCEEGSNDILVRSSVNNTLRSWSGTGNFTLRNLDVDDMTGTLTAEKSVFSGDTTWTEGCGTVTLGDGTDGGNSTIGPGAAATEIDRFSIVVSVGGDTLTGMTVTLAGDVNAYANISSVGVYTTGDVLRCSATPSSNTVALTTCGIAVTTSLTEYVVKITPLSHAGMPAAPGASYATTATVTAITTTNSTTGSDTDSAIITVDNASPANVTSATATPGNTVVDLAWTNPADADFDEIIVLRHTSAITDAPVEGTEYSIANTIGSATVVCKTATTSCQDTSLSNGTAYHYKIFTQDSRGNYDVGVVPTGSPATPAVATLSLEQASYRFFEDSGALSVATALAAQDTPATITATGDPFRLRVRLAVDGADMAVNDKYFKLQYAAKSGTCDSGFSGETYSDVTFSTPISFYDSTAASDAAATASADDPTNAGRTKVMQTFNEEHYFSNAIATVPNGQDGIWDISLYDNGATASTSYCLRIVEANDATVWTPQTAAEANPWKSVAYGNGIFVAVSSSGTNQVMTSTDGVTWTPESAAEANAWQSVTFGEGIFVAVSTDGTNQVMTSPDGETWIPRAEAEANSWRSVTYGNGLFVAVSNDGTNRVMISADGTTWTPEVAAEANPWRDVVYGEGKFVAVANNGTNRVMTSTDGETWIPEAAAEANAWFNVSYGNGVFVAVSFAGTTQAMSSPDGETWTGHVVPEANSWESLTFGNGLFVAGSTNGTNRIMTSIDGENWFSQNATEVSPWGALGYGEGLFVALADASTNRVMTSPVGHVALDSYNVVPEITTAAAGINLTISGYRWRLDNADEDSASYAVAENVPLTSGVYIGQNRRIRMSVSNTGAGSATDVVYRLEFSSGACSVWGQVPNSGDESEAWVMASSTHVTNGSSTTDESQLSNPAGKSFVAGYLMTTASETPTLTLTNSQFTEIEYSVEPTSNVVDDTVYCFRVTNSGSSSGFTYSYTPQAKSKASVYRPRSGGGGGSESSATPDPQEGGGGGGGDGGGDAENPDTPPDGDTGGGSGGGGDPGDGDSGFRHETKFAYVGTFVSVNYNGPAMWIQFFFW